MVPEGTAQQKLPMDAATYMKHVYALKKSYVCSICQGTTRVPVESPCDHVFCRECYDRLTNISATAAKGTSCPTCRTGWNHRPPATSALHQIALDTYMDFMKLHNKLAKLNGKKEEFVPESQVILYIAKDFEFPAQPTVLTTPTKPIYYGLRTPRRPVLVDTPRPVPVVGADESTDREPPPRAEGVGTEPKERAGTQSQYSTEDRVASKEVQVTVEPKETNEAGVQTRLEADKEVQTPALKVHNRRCQFPAVEHRGQQTTTYGTSDECVQTAVVVSGVTQTPLSIFNGCDGETQTEIPAQQEGQTEPTVVCDAWTEPNVQLEESEAPAGRKRKANELEDTSVADSPGEDLAEWRRRSGLHVVAAFEKRIPGFTDLVGSSHDVQQLVAHLNNSLVASGAHVAGTNAENDERPLAKKKRSEQEEEANDDNLMDGQADSLFDDTVNDAELIQAARDAERAIQEEREKQTRIQSVVQDVHLLYPQTVSSPNVFDLFGHQADAAPEQEDDTDGSRKSQDGNGEAIDDQGENVDSDAPVQQVLVPETQDLFDELNHNGDQEVHQENDYVPDSLENDPFASSQQSPVHQPFVLAEQNAQQVQPMVEQIEEPVAHLPSQMVICLSGIRENDETVTEFKRFFGVGVVSRKLGSQVTHVVVQTNDECDMPLEHRTYKYFWGMAAKKYVVSHLWLIDSLMQEQILPEDGYEVRRDLVLSESCRPADYACRRARLQKSRIFAGYSFYPLSENAWMETSFAQSLKYNQMLVLLEEAGARVVEHPNLLPDTVDNEQNPMSYILFPYRSADVEVDDMNREADRLSKRYRRQVIPADWVIDSIISNAVIQNERLDFLMPREARHSQ